MPRPAALSDFPADRHPGYGPEKGYAACIDAVHDGDTVKIVVDSGLDHFPVVWVRLLGVYTPELYEKGGVEARDFTASLCGGRLVTARTLLTPESRRETRSFTRFVASLELLDGTDVAGAIIEAGHGKPE